MSLAWLARRAGAMILRPARTWETVAPEPGGERQVLGRFVAPLAAIPAVCGALGTYLFGISFADVGVRPSLVSILSEAVVGYVLTLVGVWGLAWLVAAMGPLFGGRRERDQALKLVGYSGAAAWVAGSAHLYPNLALPVGLLAALWCAWTLYLGLPRLMRPDPERALTYFASILLASLAVGALRALAIARAAELGGPLQFS